VRISTEIGSRSDADVIHEAEGSIRQQPLGEVALANKMARMAWVVLYKGEAYRPPQLPQTVAA
jgi:hypothetical protein